MRIVLDTNVLISAFLSRAGSPFQIMQLTRTGDLVLIMSPAVIEEREQVIHVPNLRAYANYSDNQAEQFLRGIERSSFWVPMDQTLAVVADDESNNRFIELAVAGKARYIITGDKRHLLPLRRFQGIEIVSPTELLALYRSSSA